MPFRLLHEYVLLEPAIKECRFHVQVVHLQVFYAAKVRRVLSVANLATGANVSEKSRPST